MTAVSTVLAMGMMPLNLFIYSRSWTKETLAIPYVNIMISFVMTVGPAVVGIFLRWKWPRFAYYLVKVRPINFILSITWHMPYSALFGFCFIRHLVNEQ